MTTPHPRWVPGRREERKNKEPPLGVKVGMNGGTRLLKDPGVPQSSGERGVSQRGVEGVGEKRDNGGTPWLLRGVVKGGGSGCRLFRTVLERSPGGRGDTDTEPRRGGVAETGGRGRAVLENFWVGVGVTTPRLLTGSTSKWSGSME